MTVDELDQLLRDRFDLGRDDLIAALRILPAHRPRATQLTATEAQLLDDAGFTEDPAAYAEIAADVTSHMGRIYSTAYTAAEVATGLGVTDSRVRQRRLNSTLWAIDDGGTWVYPSLQFDTVRNSRESVTLRHVRGLDRVLPHLLPRGLHPAAVAGFLLSPQPELLIDGQSKSVREWLLHGQPLEPVLNLIYVADWAAT